MCIEHVQVCIRMMQGNFLVITSGQEQVEPTPSNPTHASGPTCLSSFIGNGTWTNSTLAFGPGSLPWLPCRKHRNLQPKSTLKGPSFGSCDSNCKTLGNGATAASQISCPTPPPPPTPTPAPVPSSKWRPPFLKGWSQSPCCFPHSEVFGVPASGTSCLGCAKSLHWSCPWALKDWGALIQPYFIQPEFLQAEKHIVTAPKGREVKYDTSAPHKF